MFESCKNAEKLIGVGMLAVEIVEHVQGVSDFVSAKGRIVRVHSNDSNLLWKGGNCRIMLCLCSRTLIRHLTGCIAL